VVHSDHHSPNHATLTAAFQRGHFKVTSQRIAICRFALRSREHPTAQTIFNEVKKTQPGLSLATVYNTLRVLRDLSLVQELTFAEGEKRYDPHVKPHVNVVCLQCGQIMDVESRSCHKIVSRAIRKAKFTVTQRRFEIHGICDGCRRRSKLAWKQLAVA
jgi:Fur family peroxide stress response transcriptional regulator